jgi:hypothetical protein
MQHSIITTLVKLTELGSDLGTLDGEFTGLLHRSHLFLRDDGGHLFRQGVCVLYAWNDEFEARVLGVSE